MQEIGLLLNKRKVDLAELRRTGEYVFETDFEERTQSFIHAWINGQQEFTLKTSGSTGPPSSYAFTREQMEASARLTQEALSLQPGYHALLSLDPRYVAGQMMIARAFVVGMDIVAVEPSANPLASVPTEVAIDFAAFVPYQLDAILDSGYANRLNSMRAIIIGGAAASEKLKQQVQSISAPVYATYGMTETLTHIALQKLNGRGQADAFVPLRGVTVALDARGCLVVHAPHLGKTIVTNDLAEILQEGRFQVLGRLDNVINSGGVKIAPEKVEHAVKEVFASWKMKNGALVAGVPDAGLGERVILIIEGESFDKALQNKLLHELANVLDKYEVPKEIRFLDKFIETDTQKVNRKATASLI